MTLCKAVIGLISVIIAIVLPGKTTAGNPIVIKNNVSVQSQFNSPNTVYIVSDVIDLKKSKVTLPRNSVLRFEGGSLNNGTIKYNNTFIDGRYMINCQCSGTLSNDVITPHMYGAHGDGKNDDGDAIQQAISSGKQVLFKRASYLVGKPIVFDRRDIIVDFNCSTIKKTSNQGIELTYDDIDYRNIPAVVIVKPIKSPNTNGFMTIKNLIVDGGGINTGIHAIWCRNIIFENIRIHNSVKGVLYKGFVNTFKDITIWNCKEGLVTLGGNATLFERCFTSKCGWNINKASGFTLINCSSDDNNPCYLITSSTVSMVGCTFESKGEGIIVKNSVLELSGDFQSHIYDSTKGITYITASANSTVHARGCFFHLDNYLKKKIPESNLFVVNDNSVIEVQGKVRHGNVIKIKKSFHGTMKYNSRSLKDGDNPY